MPYNNLSFVSDYARYMGLVNEACDNVNTKGIFSQEASTAGGLLLPIRTG